MEFTTYTLPQRHPGHSPSDQRQRHALRPAGERRKPRRVEESIRTGSLHRTRPVQGHGAPQGLPGELPARKPRRRTQRLHHQGGYDDPRHDPAKRLFEGRRADRRRRLPFDFPRPGAGKREGDHLRRNQHLQGLSGRHDLRHVRRHALRRIGTGTQYFRPEIEPGTLQRRVDPGVRRTHAHHRPDGFLVDRQPLGQERRNDRRPLPERHRKFRTGFLAPATRRRRTVHPSRRQTYAPDALHHRCPGAGDQRRGSGCRWHCSSICSAALRPTPC